MRRINKRKEGIFEGDASFKEALLAKEAAMVMALEKGNTCVEALIEVSG